MCQVSPNREVVVSTYTSLYKNSPQTLENCTSIVSSSYIFPDKDPHTYPSITFAFSVGPDVVWVYGVDETSIRDSDLLAANYALANCGGGGVFNGVVAFEGELTPPTISTNPQNDYSPIGISNANLVRLSASGSTKQIRGIIQPSPLQNQFLILVNIGSTNIRLVNNSGTSLAPNRLLIGGNITLNQDEGVGIVYDKTSLRWRMFAKHI